MFSRAWVTELARRYSYGGDEPARQAGARAGSVGYYTREDFLEVVRWKSPRAIPLAEQNSPDEVLHATTTAFLAEREIERMSRLLALHGVGVPVASALLHFAFPDRYPILDFRALSALGEDSRRTQYTPSFWVAYVARCQTLAETAGVSIRELDKALWQYSKENDS